MLKQNKEINERKKLKSLFWNIHIITSMLRHNIPTICFFLRIISSFFIFNLKVVNTYKSFGGNKQWQT